MSKYKYGRRSYEDAFNEDPYKHQLYGARYYDNPDYYHAPPDIGLRYPAMGRRSYDLTSSDLDRPDRKRSTATTNSRIAIIVAIVLVACALIAGIVVAVYFTSIPAPQTKPKEITEFNVSRVKAFQGEVSLAKDWNVGLSDSNSTLYKEQAKNFTSAMDAIYETNPQYNGTVVQGFRNGSIVVEYKIYFMVIVTQTVDTSAKSNNGQEGQVVNEVETTKVDTAKIMELLEDKLPKELRINVTRTSTLEEVTTTTTAPTTTIQAFTNGTTATTEKSATTTITTSITLQPTTSTTQNPTTTTTTTTKEPTIITSATATTPGPTTTTTTSTTTTTKEPTTTTTTIPSLTPTITATTTTTTPKPSSTSTTSTTPELIITTRPTSTTPEQATTTTSTTKEITNTTTTIPSIFPSTITTSTTTTTPKPSTTTTTSTTPELIITTRPTSTTPEQANTTTTASKEPTTSSTTVPTTLPSTITTSTTTTTPKLSTTTTTSTTPELIITTRTTNTTPELANTTTTASKEPTTSSTTVPTTPPSTSTTSTTTTSPKPSSATTTTTPQSTTLLTTSKLTTATTLNPATTSTVLTTSKPATNGTSVKSTTTSTTTIPEPTTFTTHGLMTTPNPCQISGKRELSVNLAFEGLVWHDQLKNSSSQIFQNYSTMVTEVIYDAVSQIPERNAICNIEVIMMMSGSTRVIGKVVVLASSYISAVGVQDFFRSVSNEQLARMQLDTDNVKAEEIPPGCDVVQQAECYAMGFTHSQTSFVAQFSSNLTNALSSYLTDSCTLGMITFALCDSYYPKCGPSGGSGLLSICHQNCLEIQKFCPTLFQFVRANPCLGGDEECVQMYPAYSLACDFNGDMCGYQNYIQSTVQWRREASPVNMGGYILFDRGPLPGSDGSAAPTTVQSYVTMPPEGTRTQAAGTPWRYSTTNLNTMGSTTSTLSNGYILVVNALSTYDWNNMSSPNFTSDGYNCYLHFSAALAVGSGGNLYTQLKLYNSFGYARTLVSEYYSGSLWTGWIDHSFYISPGDFYLIFYVTGSNFQAALDNVYLSGCNGNTNTPYPSPSPSPGDFFYYGQNCPNWSCLSGGSCLYTEEGCYYCICAPGYHGQTCEYGNRSSNGTSGTVNTTQTPGSTTESMTFYYDQNCPSWNCNNGASCFYRSSTGCYFCFCPSGFTGRYCEIFVTTTPSTTLPVKYDLEIRLSNQIYKYGRVEIRRRNSSDEWGTICDDMWDDLDAKVVCRNLGYPEDIEAYSYRGAFFGQGYGPIWINRVDCSGNEQFLSNCVSQQWGNIHCTHIQDAGVSCGQNIPTTPMPNYTTVTTPSPSGGLKVRLVNGPSCIVGRVEIWYQGQWGTVCDDNWSNADAEVICRMLGYSTFGAIAYDSARYGQGTGPILLDEVMCYGWESSIADCSHNSWGKHDCSHLEDAAVRCGETEDQCFAQNTVDCDFDGSSCGYTTAAVSGSQVWRIQYVQGIPPLPSTSALNYSIEGNRVAYYININGTETDEAYLKSPNFTMNTSTNILEFYYLMNASTLGALRLDGEGMELWESPVLRSEEENKWMYHCASLDQLMPDIEQTVSFYAKKGPINFRVIAVDNIELREGTCQYGLEDATCDFERPSVHGYSINCSYCKTLIPKFRWYWGNGFTPSEETGPDVDHTYGNNKGHYMYAEASYGEEGDATALTFPIVYTKTTFRALQFYYNMYGRDTGSLQLMLEYSGQKKVVWEKTGNNGNLWRKDCALLPLNSNVTISFVAVKGPGPYGDIAIDDIELLTENCPHPITCMEDFQRCGYTRSSESEEYMWDWSGDIRGDSFGCNFEADDCSFNSSTWQHVESSRITQLGNIIHDPVYGERGHYMYTASTAYWYSSYLYSPWFMTETGSICQLSFMYKCNLNSSYMDFYVSLSGKKLGQYGTVFYRSHYSSINWTTVSINISIADETILTFAIYGSRFEIALDEIDSNCVGFGADVEGQMAILRSPAFQNKQEAQYLIFYHQIPTTDTIKVMFQNHDDGTETLLSSLSSITDSLELVCINLPGVVANTSISFEAIRGDNSIKSSYYTAIKSIEIKDGLCPDTLDKHNCTFESEDALCGRNITSSVATSCDLPVYMWVRHSGTTWTAGTGPDFDHTFNIDEINQSVTYGNQTGKGHYMYADASVGSLGDKTTLTLKDFLVGKFCSLRFFYHMYGNSTPVLRVRETRGAVEMVLPSLNLNAWIPSCLKLKNDCTVQESTGRSVSFVAERGNGPFGDIAIDDISLSMEECPYASINCTFMDGMCGYVAEYGWELNQTADGGYLAVRNGEAGKLVSPSVRGPGCITLYYTATTEYMYAFLSVINLTIGNEVYPILMDGRTRMIIVPIRTAELYSLVMLMSSTFYDGAFYLHNVTFSSECPMLVCKDSDFACKHYCISATNTCDGHTWHCSDGSDEADHLCPSSIECDFNKMYACNYTFTNAHFTGFKYNITSGILDNSVQLFHVLSFMESPVGVFDSMFCLQYKYTQYGEGRHRLVSNTSDYLKNLYIFDGLKAQGIPVTLQANLPSGNYSIIFEFQTNNKTGSYAEIDDVEILAGRCLNYSVFCKLNKEILCHNIMWNGDILDICLPNADKCNQHVDCSDGSDEMGCSYSLECDFNEHMCGYKKDLLSSAQWGREASPINMEGYTLFDRGPLPGFNWSTTPTPVSYNGSLPPEGTVTQATGTPWIYSTTWLDTMNYTSTMTTGYILVVNASLTPASTNLYSPNFTSAGYNCYLHFSAALAVGSVGSLYTQLNLYNSYGYARTLSSQYYSGSLWTGWIDQALYISPGNFYLIFYVSGSNFQAALDNVYLSGCNGQGLTTTLQPYLTTTSRATSGGFVPFITYIDARSNVTHANITCIAIGYPNPNIAYYISYGTRFVDGNITGHTIVGNSMIVNYNYTWSSYYCKASNAFGFDIYYFNKPGIPSLWTSDITSTSVMLHVIPPPSGNLPLISYIIQHFFNSEWRIAAIFLANITSYNVTGLTPNSTNNFVVAASNALGYGNYSNQIVITLGNSTWTTRMPVTTVSPGQGLTTISQPYLTNTSRTTSGGFVPYITYIDARSNVTHANITCITIGYPNPNIAYYISYGSRFVDGNITGHTIVGNSMIVNYNYTWSSYYCKASNAFGFDIYYFNKTGIPSLWTSDITSTSVMLHVIPPPSGNLPLISYIIQHLFNSEWRIAAILLANITSYNVTGLTPNSTNNFVVAASNALGYGNYSNQLVVTLGNSTWTTIMPATTVSPGGFVPYITYIDARSNVTHANITCITIGYPNPNIAYYISYGSRFVDRNITGHTIVGNSMIVNYNYTWSSYYCKASNAFGFDISYFNKTGIPSLWTSDITSTSVMLHVIPPPSGNLPLISYIIQHLFNSEWRIAAILLANITSYNVTGLTPNSTNNFVVAASNALGYGNYSNQLVVTLGHTTIPTTMSTTTVTGDSCEMLGSLSCFSGNQCYYRFQRCNGYFDCRDQSDEWDCHTTIPTTMSTTTVTGDSCEMLGFLSCFSGIQCYYRFQRCNGYFDCRDQSDEWDCYTTIPTTMSTTKVTGDSCEMLGSLSCFSGNQCYYRFQRCNGYFDCRDQSDEWDCNSTWTTTASTTVSLDGCYSNPVFTCFKYGFERVIMPSITGHTSVTEAGNQLMFSINNIWSFLANIPSASTCINPLLTFLCGSYMSDCVMGEQRLLCRESCEAIAKNCMNINTSNIGEVSNIEYFCKFLPYQVDDQSCLPINISDLEANSTVPDNDSTPMIKELRLVNGNSQYSGRLEILVNGIWGTVCDSRYSNDFFSAAAFCFELGFSYNGRWIYGSYYGYGPRTVINGIYCPPGGRDLDNCTIQFDSYCPYSSYSNMGLVCVPTSVTCNFHVSDCGYYGDSWYRTLSEENIYLMTTNAQEGEVTELMSPRFTAKSLNSVTFTYKISKWISGKYMLSVDNGRNRTALWQLDGRELDGVFKDCVEVWGFRDVKIQLVFSVMIGQPLDTTKSTAQGVLNVSVNSGSCPGVFPAVACTFESSTACQFVATCNNKNGYRFQMKSGPSDSSYTGPQIDFTTQNNTGHYMIADASYGEEGDSADFKISVTVESHQYYLRYQYYMSGPNVGSLRVHINGKNGPTSILISEHHGDQGESWNSACWTIPSTSLSMFYIVFNATRGNGTQGDIAVDDIEYNTKPCPHPVSCDFKRPNFCDYNFSQTAYHWQGDYLWQQNGTKLASGNFIRTNPYNGSEGDVAEVHTPILNLGADTKCVSFAFIMSGEDVGSLNVYVVYDNIVAHRKLGFSAAGNQGTNWYQANAIIEYANSTYKTATIVFSAEKGDGTDSYIGLDNIIISSEECAYGIQNKVCDFDNPYLCGIQSNCSDGSQYQWQIYKGASMTNGTGASSDANEDFEGSYLTVDSSYGGLGDISFAWFPPIHTSSATKLIFDYHMYGRNEDFNNLTLLFGTQSGLTTLDQLCCNKWNVWIFRCLPLPNNTQGTVYFKATRKNGVFGDISLDNVGLIEGNCPTQSVECDFDKDDFICGYSGWERTLQDTNYFMSATNSNGTSILMAPFAAYDGPACIGFDYRVSLNDFSWSGSGLLLNVSFEMTSGEHSENLFDVSKDTGDEWVSGQIQIPELNNAVRFRIIFAAYGRGYFAVDKVILKGGQCSLPTCTTDEFACIEKCIPKALECDKKSNCANGRDERVSCTPSMACDFEMAYHCGYQNTSYNFFNAGWEWVQNLTSRIRNATWNIVDEMNESGYFLVASPLGYYDIVTVQSPTEKLAENKCLRFSFFGNGLLNVYINGITASAWSDVANDEQFSWQSGQLNLPVGDISVKFSASINQMRWVDSFIGIDNVELLNGSCASHVISCSEFSIRCLDNSKCIDLHQLCNRIPDCPDGSDESEDYCSVTMACQFEDDYLCGYRNLQNDSTWYQRSGNFFKLPQYDHTYGNETGQFMIAYNTSDLGVYYNWLSYYGPGYPHRLEYSNSTLISPSENFTTESCVYFYYYLNGTAVRPNPLSAQLFVYVNSSTGRRLAWYDHINRTVNGWLKGWVSVYPGHAEVIFVAKTITTTTVWPGVVALDDVSVISRPCPAFPDCGHDTFRCSTSRICIPVYMQCDGGNDCLDGSDEENCISKPNYQLELINGDGSYGSIAIFYQGLWRPVCMSVYSLTAGSDKTVQLACKKVGYTGRYQGAFVNSWQQPVQYAMQVSCSSYTQDILNCSMYLTQTSSNCYYYQAAFCSNDECFSGERVCPPDYTYSNYFSTTKCISYQYFCDGIPDCPGATDELNCANCSNSEFECTNHQCIPAPQQCDGTPQCGDNSDEYGCVIVTSNRSQIYHYHLSAYLPVCYNNMNSNLANILCSLSGQGSSSHYQLYTFVRNGTLLTPQSNATFLSLVPGYAASIEPCYSVLLQCASIECGSTIFDDSRLPKILFGRDAVLGQLPWQIALYANGEFICGGSIIHPNWVLTAAHCTEYLKSYSVIVGAVEVEEFSSISYQGQLHNSSRTYNNPLYNRNFDNDNSLLYLSQPIAFNNYVRPICIASKRTVDEMLKAGFNTECYVSGWGNIHGYVNMETWEGSLQVVRVQLYNKEECNKIYNDVYWSYPQNTTVCIDNQNLGSPTCFGDSGGSLICRNKYGRFELLGTLSWGYGSCFKDGYPDIFQLTYPHASWIEMTTGLNFSDLTMDIE
ncbi:hypothetical protein CHS0354_016949 [Potamilus streckersoni]|uniref:Uncharacterized protein n=1 Tax=Potamilus streckersoni TaxID=2493646 RepID=A0AAE0S7Y2_9BIVA|nr:hypothetical protein CHS0354_016949 [Potamilus streckersoni]